MDLLAECAYCSKKVAARYKRACCAEHSPLNEAIWVEFYGAPDERMQCFTGFAPGFCGVETEPNGGFVCQECWEKLIDADADYDSRR